MVEEIRINKFLSMAGYCSRREADSLISRGKVTIDGKIAQMGDKVTPDQHVYVGGREIFPEEEPILLAFHKPVGIVCTSARGEGDNIVDYINYPKRIYPVGRLDKDSEGLILMTNQGDIVNRMMRSGNCHEKEYEVTVDRRVTDDFLAGMARGVPLADLRVTTRPCRLQKTGQKSFSIILTQGYNRQIRRMCAYFGYHVVKLKRIRIMNIMLGDLKEGRWRDVTMAERKTLYRMLADSSNETVTASANDKDRRNNRKKACRR